MTYYGSLTFGAASDTDGDGFTFAQELFRGYSPRVVDTLDQGGVSRRRAVTVPTNVGVADQPPAIGYNTAVNITQTSGRLTAQVNPANAATTVYFEWGLTSTYGQQTASQSIGSGPLAIPVGIDVTALAPDTLYHFRAIASSLLGTSTGDNFSFRTAQPISTVNPPVITSTLAANAINGTAFSYQITASNIPTAYNATGLPTGLSVNTVSGLISGTPGVTGVVTIAISASNAGGTGTANLVLTILPPAPTITSALVALGAQGVAFTYQITATNSPSKNGKMKEAYTTDLKEGTLEHEDAVPKPSKPHVQVGRNVQRLRLRAKLTQERLAEIVDIDLRSLQRIESGSWNVTVDHLERLRAGLGCKWRSLIRGLD